MPRHLKREIESLKKKILYLGALVESQVQKAVRALEARDNKLAEEVIGSDEEVDDSEVEVEEECLKIIALHQPVAIDLRFLIAVLKINNDLERIGDLAVNIAERAAYLAVTRKIDIPLDFLGMVEKTRAMLNGSLEALIELDPSRAYRVCLADDEVDSINRDMYNRIQEGIRLHPENVEALIHLLSASRHLERIADHATNIAEDVIYMIEGVIVRHRTEDFRPE